MYATFQAKGVHMLDAPVSGGVIGARSGRLAVMVGGDEATYQQVKPILDAIGDNVVYCGSIGAGSICKLVHNCISAIVSQAISECFTLGVKAGSGPQGVVGDHPVGVVWAERGRDSPVAGDLVQRRFCTQLGEGFF